MIPSERDNSNFESVKRNKKKMRHQTAPLIKVVFLVFWNVSAVLERLRSPVFFECRCEEKKI